MFFWFLFDMKFFSSFEKKDEYVIFVQKGNDTFVIRFVIVKLMIKNIYRQVFCVTSAIILMLTALNELLYSFNELSSINSHLSNINKCISIPKNIVYSFILIHNHIQEGVILS